VGRNEKQDANGAKMLKTTTKSRNGDAILMEAPTTSRTIKMVDGRGESNRRLKDPSAHFNQSLQLELPP